MTRFLRAFGIIALLGLGACNTSSPGIADTTQIFDSISAQYVQGCGSAMIGVRGIRQTTTAWFWIRCGESVVYKDRVGVTEDPDPQASYEIGPVPLGTTSCDTQCTVYASHKEADIGKRWVNTAPVSAPPTPVTNSK